MNIKEIKKYFDSCVAYWMSNGDSKGLATVKAIWWDCVEVWNFDKSWTDENIKFINQYRSYKPYDSIPEPSRVAEGNA